MNDIPTSAMDIVICNVGFMCAEIAIKHVYWLVCKYKSTLAHIIELSPRCKNILYIIRKILVLKIKKIYMRIDK